MSGRFRAPASDGEVLAVPPLGELDWIRANRRLLNEASAPIDGVPLCRFRELARRELGFSAAPVVLTGHQPELFHPGVWLKNFAAHALARTLGGTGVNLVVDNDTLKVPALRVPGAARTDVVPFDAPGEAPYETRGVKDAALFASFAERVRAVAALPFRPLLDEVWPGIVADDRTIGARFTAARVKVERAWGGGNVELPVSRLARTECFQRFVRHVAADADRFRACYNAAVRAYRARHKLKSTSHPVPELAGGELPFWGPADADGKRGRATTPGDVRPRALTLTLYARLVLGDGFLHGIGGGKYDEVTDAIMRYYFGTEPPAYMVLSGTRFLPLGVRPAEPGDVARTRELVRDMQWSPHRHTSNAAARREHADLVRGATGKDGYRAFRALRERLRPEIRETRGIAGAELRLAELAAERDAMRTRRDYSWVLYPADVLRAFVTGGVSCPG